MTMHLIWIILIGFLVGLVARAIHPGDDKLGFILTSLLGIGGALLATFAGQMLGLYAPGEPAGFIGGVLGAIALMVIARAIRKG